MTFTLQAADPAFYTARGRWETEPGDFAVMVGPNSRDVSEARFAVR